MERMLSQLFGRVQLVAPEYSAAHQTSRDLAGGAYNMVHKAVTTTNIIT